MKSAVVQAEKGKRQRGRDSFLECWFIFFLCFCICNSVFMWAPLSVIKGSRETCRKNSKDDKMGSCERKTQDRTQEIVSVSSGALIEIVFPYRNIVRTGSADLFIHLICAVRVAPCWGTGRTRQTRALLSWSFQFSGEDRYQRNTVKRSQVP